MRKNIARVLLYTACAVLVVFYILVLWWGKNPKVGTEYRMYYLTHELTDWPGYGNLKYTFGKRYVQNIKTVMVKNKAMSAAVKVRAGRKQRDMKERRIQTKIHIYTIFRRNHLIIYILYVILRNMIQQPLVIKELKYM